MIDHDHPFAQFFDVAEIVRCEDDGGAALSIDGADELANALFGDHVQADRRLIQEEQPRIV